METGWLPPSHGGSWLWSLLVGELSGFAARAMPFADDGPALRADQVRPADGVAAFGEGLRVLGWPAPGGVLTVHRVRLRLEGGGAEPGYRRRESPVSTIIAHIK